MSAVVIEPDGRVRREDRPSITPDWISGYLLCEWAEHLNLPGFGAAIWVADNGHDIGLPVNMTASVLALTAGTTSPLAGTAIVTAWDPASRDTCLDLSSDRARFIQAMALDITAAISGRDGDVSHLAGDDPGQFVLVIRAGAEFLRACTEPADGNAVSALDRVGQGGSDA